MSKYLDLYNYSLGQNIIVDGTKVVESIKESLEPLIKDLNYIVLTMDKHAFKSDTKEYKLYMIASVLVGLSGLANVQDDFIKNYTPSVSIYDIEIEDIFYIVKVIITNYKINTVLLGDDLMNNSVYLEYYCNLVGFYNYFVGDKNKFNCEEVCNLYVRDFSDVFEDKLLSVEV